ncbi:MAG: class IV adenylate cyclase [Anaerolineales bacterium]|nr:class IV adenylate cyclase [Anaerolineales bacterium]
MSQTQQLEVEVKFLLTDRAAFRARLLASGATLHKARVFERNLRLDTLDNRLLQQEELLRLRQDTAVRLTYKGLAAEDEHSEAKVREELEIEVSNFETAVLIFQRLGFTPVQIYEKYRETFTWQDVEIVLDELPFGDFVELEGTEPAIKTVAAALELPWEKRVVNNYLGLMAAVKTHYHLDFDDLTFANFQDLNAPVAALLPAVE